MWNMPNKKKDKKKKKKKQIKEDENINKKDDTDTDDEKIFKSITKYSKPLDNKIKNKINSTLAGIGIIPLLCIIYDVFLNNKVMWNILLFLSIFYVVFCLIKKYSIYILVCSIVVNFIYTIYGLWNNNSVFLNLIYFMANFVPLYVVAKYWKNVKKLGGCILGLIIGLVLINGYTTHPICTALFIICATSMIFLGKIFTVV